jgi:vacuolar protein sorting-associated protein 72
MTEGDGRSGRSTRANRGKRMAELIGEEVEIDNSFWNLQMFQDEDDDRDFVDVEKLEDVAVVCDVQTDSDQDEDEEPQQRPQRQRKKNKAYVDPKLKKRSERIMQRQSMRTRPSPSSSPPPNPVVRPTPRPSLKRQQTEKPVVFPSSSSFVTLRQSTRDLSARSEESRAIRLEEKRRRLSRQTRRVREREFTQEEMLEEAKGTEIRNLESLKELLKWEEEKKLKNKQKTLINQTPQIRFLSTRECDFITFPEDYVIFPSSYD